MVTIAHVTTKSRTALVFCTQHQKLVRSKSINTLRVSIYNIKNNANKFVLTPAKFPSKLRLFLGNNDIKLSLMDLK